MESQGQAIRPAVERYREYTLQICQGTDRESIVVGCHHLVHAIVDIGLS
jgi:hypothetical protein